jgi:deazaflavin-dependent oxidoreductase (nitroreductase family)
MDSRVKRRWVRLLQKYVANPPMKAATFLGLVPGHAIIETTGRKTGKKRRTVVGVHEEGSALWIVAEQGRHAGYVRNIDARPRLRVRLRGRWRTGVGTVVANDDANARLEKFGRASHAAAVRRFGTELLSVRIDLESGPEHGPPRQSRPEDFNAMYAGTPPWDIGRPQPAFLELAEQEVLRGRVLDVGCGTGEHALMAAGLGLDATGIDAAPAAIGIAEGKARDRGLTARFLVWDALQLAALGERFDTVLDSGLFHVFDDADRVRFVDSLRAVIPTGGQYFMLCFSDRQPGDWGPRRVTQDEIRASFAHGWQVDTIETATMDVTIDPGGVFAWRAAITRTH